MEFLAVESWEKHVRQHDRVTRADADLENRAKQFHIGPDPPVIAHMIYSSRTEE